MGWRSGLCAGALRSEKWVAGVLWSVALFGWAVRATGVSPLLGDLIGFCRNSYKFRYA